MIEVDVRPRHVRTLEGLLEKIRERAGQLKPAIGWSRAAMISSSST
jgi:hypothetical protein